MIPAQIATSVVTLLVPFLIKGGEAFSEKIGEATWEKLKALYQTIQSKFSSDKDSYAQQVLKRLEESPSSELRQRSLVEVLTEKLEIDCDFSSKIAQLTQNTTQGQEIGQFTTQVYGQAKVKNVINIAQSNEVNID